MRRCLLLLAANLVSAGCTCTQLPRTNSLPLPAAPAASPTILRASHSSTDAIPPKSTAVATSNIAAAEDPADFRRLTAFETQELAVQSSSAAKLLELEPNPSRQRFWLNRKIAPASENLRPLVLELAADDARNRDAGTALDLYYKLAGAEAGRALYQELKDELSKLADDARKAEDAGLKDRIDREELASQLTEAQIEIARFDASIAQLNAGLKLNLGLPIDPRARLLPEDPLQITAGSVNVEEAVRTGLKRRSDLAILQSLASAPDSDEARRLLAIANPLLADAVKAELPPGIRFLAGILTFCTGGAWPAPIDPAATSDQLQALLTERERQAEVEIRIAASQAEETAIAARLQADLSTQLRKRLAELEKEQAAGKGVLSDLTRVHGALRKAEGAALRAKVDHLCAHAKLRQSQGLLVREVYNSVGP